MKCAKMMRVQIQGENASFTL
ncbi:tetracycline resistance efflux system leader peptide [Bacillus bruguierae]